MIRRVVTLLTAEQRSGKMYSITVENVSDIFELISSSDGEHKDFGIGSSGITGSTGNLL